MRGKNRCLIERVEGRLHPEIMGARVLEDRVHFSLAEKGTQAPILLIYEKNSPDPVASIPFPEENRFGDVYAMIVKGIDPAQHLYAFQAGKRIFCDPYARMVYGRERFGDAAHLERVCRAGFLPDRFDWAGDRPIGLRMDQLIIYRLHVRGFTMHPSARVKGRGTFLGVTEKIPYLKGLGVTAVELMPVTEFEEVEADVCYDPLTDQDVCKPTGRVNYWGYGPSCLFAPKASFHSGAGGLDQSEELKYLVKTLHENRMEVIFELYFPPELSDTQVLEVLKFWVLEYHVDGIHIAGRAALPAAAKEPVLAATKLFSADWGGAERGRIRHLCLYHDGFLADMRRFLKGDEDQLQTAVSRIRANPADMGVVNYMAHTNGFSLSDMVSYDRKHNEDNGEQNRDGTDYNFSWNCGVEGPTRRKQIVRLRRNQMRNALTMVFLSQGIPLLEAGDEMGHTRRGNNNAFCQDNEISWLNWKVGKYGEELRAYVQFLIGLRKTYAVFSPREPLRGLDYRNLGYPDISVHGVNPWKPEYEAFRRQAGILYNGAYACPPEPHLFYVLYNMHWTEQQFSLPRLAKEAQWHMIIHTTKEAPNFYPPDRDAPLPESQDTLWVPARTIIVLMSWEEIRNEKQRKIKQESNLSNLPV